MNGASFSARADSSASLGKSAAGTNSGILVLGKVPGDCRGDLRLHQLFAGEPSR